MSSILYKLAIFDFDGTLVDSVPGMTSIIRQVAQEYRMPPSILEKWITLIGIPLEDQMKILFPNGKEVFWQEVAKRYRTVYDIVGVKDFPLFFDTVRVLESLDEKGVQMAILSSKQRRFIEKVLNHHNLSHFFNPVLGSEDISNHKPHPEGVLRMLETLSIKPEEAIFIGDSLFDVEVAQRANVCVVAVSTGTHDRDTLKRFEPDYLVTSLQEILPIFLAA